MSELDAARKEMAVEILEVFGVDATYTFENQTTKAIKVRFDQNVEVLDKDSGGIATIEYVVGIDPVDIPSPKTTDTITINTVVYSIGRQLGDNGGLNRYEVI